MAPKKPLDIPLSKQRPANLPTHDSQGRKLPLTFKAVTGAMKRKFHDPTGKEVRVTIFAGKMQRSQHTFRDLKIATPLLNTALAVWKDVGSGPGTAHRNKTQRVRVEFGDGRLMNLKVGDKTPKR